MPAVQQLSPVYPLGSTINERGVLEIGGCDTLELAHEFGTPAYVVAEDDIRARARAFVEAFRARADAFDVLFASKAFPCTAVYRLLAEEGIGCDVASGGAAASTRRASTCTATRSPTPRSSRRWPRGWGTSSSTTSTRSTAWTASSARAGARLCSSA
jgi:hypothetical protein